MNNIYQITHADGGREWICAPSYLSAICQYIIITECDIHDITDAELEIVPKGQWHNHFVKMDDKGTEISFRDWMNENGDDTGIICGSMYEV
jgi:hypothetical protein